MVSTLQASHCISQYLQDKHSGTFSSIVHFFHVNCMIAPYQNVVCLLFKHSSHEVSEKNICHMTLQYNLSNRYWLIHLLAVLGKILGKFVKLS